LTTISEYETIHNREEPHPAPNKRGLFILGRLFRTDSDRRGRKKRVRCPIIFRAENKGLNAVSTQKRALQKLSVHSKGLNSKFHVSVHYKRLTARKTAQILEKIARDGNFPELCWDLQLCVLFSIT
jgi:hypothetical protein